MSYTLLKNADLFIERWIHEAQNDWEDAGSSDELVLWCRAGRVELDRQGDQLKVQVGNQAYLITPAHSQQRLTVQCTSPSADYRIAATFDWPLRIDVGASSRKSTLDTRIQGLRIHGTPQFQRRVMDQLQSLGHQPALKQLLEDVRLVLQRDKAKLTLMQQYVGTTPFFDSWGFGKDRQEALRSGMILLYNPYDNPSDSVAELFTALQHVYGLLTGTVIPAG
ncbi:hypothetical protein ACIQUS_16540 [Pseudomonas sp. NPDC090755]|uniref:hypothetical protein n=1 Tax=Pseudomonas sp. NPDC090755 TaxID=3364481 RepID=UPI00383B0E14